MVKNMQPTVISLFAGCGGSSLGYKLAGYKELLAIDFDEDSVITFKLNFPETPIWKKDISTITGKEIMDTCNITLGELDVLDGSPPCQGFSSAGKRKIIDKRNDLFLEFVRLILEIKPKVFIMENVSGMVYGKMKGKFKEIILELKKTNYNVQCALLNTVNYNVPQNRKRLIFIGVRNDIRINPTFPLPSKKIITVKEAISSLPKQIEDRQMKEWLKIAYYKIPALCGNKKTEKIFIRYKGTSGGSINTIKLAWNKPSPTLLKSEISVSGLLHPSESRYLTISELRRICSFPDNFIFTNRKNA